MADFVAVLRKTIDGLADPTPELRQRVYAKARATIEQKLVALNATEAVAKRQTKALEEAIAEVESSFAPAVTDFAPAVEEVDELMPAPLPIPVAPPVPEVSPPPIAEAPPQTSSIPEELEPSPALSPSPSFTKVGSHPDALEDFLSSQAPNEDKAEFTADVSQNDIVRGPRAENGDDGLSISSEDGPSSDYGVYTRRGGIKQPTQKRSLTPLLGILAVLLVLAGVGFAGWTYRGKIAEQASSVKEYLANLTTSDSPEEPKPEETAVNKPAEPVQPAQPAQPTPAPTTAESAEPKPEPKLTQRLLPDGQEVNPGPANDTPSLGEGTSVASSTPDQASTPSATPGQQAAGQGQPAVALPIGQKAFFYEERSGQDAGTADAGGVVWSVVQESPGNDLPPEPAIRAEVTIPDRGINLRMIIRRNGDKSLPASHLVEMIFTVPEGFVGGSIDNVSRMTFKDTEQSPGSPLVGIPAKIADNFFIIAMNDAKTAIDTNMSLMRRQSWIDIPIAYKTGRRALLTLEKGLPGEKAFDEVLKAWAAKAGG
ncbi:transcriptional regulator [Phyllobacterium lublinensis]|uniref:transcriptional regulator n=1 Tax=Phyllobacterium lublinensis TaxID=2875708 RepID=UPI001CCFA5A4|nr:transcriptional regulator [Phyllobacterium sp. 2063]MBZ9654652.1 transcriptional regulator [Phyllobacterium sp. 2063]